MSRLSFAVVLTLSSFALANSGVQLPLSNYSAGTESTSPGPITNAGFETADGSNVPTGWSPTSTVMTSGAPVSPPTPNNAGTRSAQARRVGGVSSLQDYFLNQTVTLQPNTDYVLSAYIWNFAFAGPNPPTDFNAGDLAVVQLRDNENFFNTAGIILERTAKNSGDGAGGYFLYKTFNSNQFTSTTVGLEVNFDPNQDVQLGVPRPELSAQWDNLAITPLNTFAAQRFTATGPGPLAYEAASNWTNGPADAIGAVATFNGAVAADALVNLNGARTVAVISRNGSGRYVLQNGTLILDHEEPTDAVILNNLGGGIDIAAPLVIGVGTMGNPAALVTRNFRAHVAQASELTTISGTVSAASHTTLGTGNYNLTKTGAGRLDLARVIDVKTLRVNQGRVRMIPGSTRAASRVQAIEIDPAAAVAQIDLNNTAMVVDYTGDSPLAAIKALIASGFNNGGASGNGLISSFSAHSVGYAEASTLGSIPSVFGTVDGTSILLRGTRGGDSNLDGIVNIGDFSQLASNFNTPGDWVKGDFNYDGLINIGDFSILASNFNQSINPARAAVPEPAGAGAIILLTLLSRLRLRLNSRET